jgi:hypothetical protein
MKNLLLTFILVLMSFMTFSQVPANIYISNQNECLYGLTNTYVSEVGSGSMIPTSIDSMQSQNIHHYIIDAPVSNNGVAFYPITVTVCLYVGATQEPFPPQTPQCFTQTTNFTIFINFVVDCSVLELNEVTVNKKEIVKVVDLMGRETTIMFNQPMIYVYSDGSKEIMYINE